MGFAMGKQVTVYDPHSSQRALVYEQNEEDIRFRRRIAQRRWIRSCLCLCAAFLVLILVLVCLGAIIWVTLKPKAPHLSLQGITLHDLKVCNQFCSRLNPTLPIVALCSAMAQSCIYACFSVLISTVVSKTSLNPCHAVNLFCCFKKPH